MITAEKLKTLTTLTNTTLGLIAPRPGTRYVSSQFLGMTNGNQFCYSVTDSDGTVSKVFLNYDPAANKLTVDM
jgi:hypothetical protein